MLAPDSRIAIIRLGGLREVVQSVPLACALKKRYPESHITWVTDEVSADLLLDHRAIDRVAVYPRAAWRRRGLVTWVRGLFYLGGMMRRRRPGLAVDLQGNAESSLLLRLSGAPLRLTFGGSVAARLAGAGRRERGPCGVQSLVGRLDLPQPGEEPDFGFKPSPSGQRGAERLFRRMGIPPGARPVAVIPFSCTDAAAWPAARYVRLATHLLRQGYGPVLVIGDARDHEEGRYLARRMGVGAWSLAGEAGPLVVREVLRRCRLAVGNDSGWSVLAAALGIPTVIIYGPTRPDESLPANAHPFTAQASCSPCGRSSCSRLVCQRRITPGSVYRHILSLLPAQSPPEPGGCEARNQAARMSFRATAAMRRSGRPGGGTV